MATAVDRHLILLRTAIQAHGGVLFKTVGDAVQAAFPPLQMRLPLPSMPSVLCLPKVGQRAIRCVRMAIHAGEAMVHNGEYHDRS